MSHGLGGESLFLGWRTWLPLDVNHVKFGNAWRLYSKEELPLGVRDTVDTDCATICSGPRRVLLARHEGLLNPLKTLGTTSSLMSMTPFEEHLESSFPWRPPNCASTSSISGLLEKTQAKYSSNVQICAVPLTSDDSDKLCNSAMNRNPIPKQAQEKSVVSLLKKLR